MSKWVSRWCVFMGIVACWQLPQGQSQTPPPDASTTTPAEDRLTLPPSGGPPTREPSISYWVNQLGSDQFLRRELATRKLAKAGPEAIPAIVEVIRTGDLETVERAVKVMSEIALAQPPDEDGGAWGELNRLASLASGVRAARSKAALAEVREHRDEQARTALTAAGIFVGTDEFIVLASSELRMMVQIDEKWRGDLTSLQWLRWLQGIEFARVKGPAVRREVLEKLVQIPDLGTLAIVDGTVDRRTLEPLLTMARIDSLEFHYVKLTPELCDLIVAMPIRVSLNLMGTGVAVEKVDQMRAALPGLLIDHKQGGFLGVKCLASFDVCQISDVLAGSAAEAAGLIRGDVIVRIGDSEVNEFKDLQNAINQHLPGDEVQVMYRRGDQINSVTLQLRRL